jgi:hypothetical protein
MKPDEQGAATPLRNKRSSMKKMPTLFVRNPDDRRYVTDQVTPGCEWVLAGEGVATRKYDGTCVMYDGSRWWARREVKAGKIPPPNFAPVEQDETTGKVVGWEPIAQSPFQKFLAEAAGSGPWEAATYELCGPKINGNPESFERHTLVRHADAQTVEKLYDASAGSNTHPASLVPFLGKKYGWEGIVWHHPDGRMAKLKAKDFPS